MDVKTVTDQVHALIQQEMNESSILLGIERNNPQNLPLLHENLAKQLQEKTFDEEHNLVLMTLYQFNPQSIEMQQAKDLLLKVCMHIGETSLSLFESMIADALLEDESVKALLTMARALDSCNFNTFWAVLKEHSSEIDVSRVDGFEEHVRAYISQCYKNLYSRVSTEEFAAGLNLTEGEVQEYLSKESLRVEDDKILLNITHETTISSKRILESIPFADINKTCMQACN